MNRKILLLEPNYKNKYPPINLMKLSTYFREVCKDEVRFFKGSLKNFAAQLLLENFFKPENKFGQLNLFEDYDNPVELFGAHAEQLLNFIKFGKKIYLDAVPNLCDTNHERELRKLHQRFRDKNFPKFDIICVTTLFTFFWKETICTINAAKNFLKVDGKIFVGGVAATLVPKELEAETGIKPHIGLLDSPDDLGKPDDVIIDELQLDYSILEEISYKYPASNAYFGYTTRGCVRRCEFCAVPTLEPKYKNFIGIHEQLARTEEKFGAKKFLLLLDNNVLASGDFDKIIDEIKACGFAKGATFTPPNEYDVALKNLRAGYNDRAYIKKIFRLYDELSRRLSEEDAGIFYTEREKKSLLSEVSATKQNIFELDDFVKPLFEKLFKHNKNIRRFVDFNQGLDARLITPKKMARLAEINIRPMRIAFDHVEQRDIYERAVRLAAENGIHDLSNYILYNFEDTPDDLYTRLKINIDLCEELQVNIYSFPMKYHPITDPKYFRNRDYIGRNWNRKFIRAIQAILNSTKGKIGRGKNFFEAAFGKNLDEFHDLLWMPEALIIHRQRYFDNVTKDWREKFHALSPSELEEIKKIIAINKFSDAVISAANSEAIREVLKFYKITRDKI